MRWEIHPSPTNYKSEEAVLCKTRAGEEAPWRPGSLPTGLPHSPVAAPTPCHGQLMYLFLVVGWLAKPGPRGGRGQYGLCLGLRLWRGVGVTLGVR